MHETQQPEGTMRYIAEPHIFDLWHIRDTEFEGPGSVFSAPVVLVVTTRDAAERIAGEMNS